MITFHDEHASAPGYVADFLCAKMISLGQVIIDDDIETWYTIYNRLWMRSGDKITTINTDQIEAAVEPNPGSIDARMLTAFMLLKKQGVL